MNESVFPRALDSYPAEAATILGTLSQRAAAEPFNLVATGIFLLAILHTFSAARFARLAHDVQRRHDARCRANGLPPVPSVLAETLHFLGEVEVVFGLWAIVLLVAITATEGWTTAKEYFNGTVNYTEPVFVVVIMALASTRPIVGFAESALSWVARMGRGTPAAWWATILTIGPLLGSFITEPAAMTICALLHGGLQGWWMAPVLGGLSQTPLFLGATFLTAFNDNALITYLATLVPNLDDRLKIAVVEGAVTGGGLTVIANAPNPVGQAFLGRFFDNAIGPLMLMAGALVPTLLAGAAFFLT
jgi:hypothetical protein